MYKAIIKILDQEFESKGETLEKVFDGFPFKKWSEVKTRGYLTVLNGDKKYERFANALFLRQLLFNKLSQKIKIKLIKDVIG
jgi:hypothetical protein